MGPPDGVREGQGATADKGGGARTLREESGMYAEQSLREGNILESLDQLQQQVRDDPSNAKLRVFLFQLLAVLGEWNRAMTQLNVVGDMDAGALAMVQMYREALKCEVLRAEIFAGQRSPLIFGEPEEWVAILTQALRLTAEGQHERSGVLRKMAFDAAPTSSGTIDDRPFEWIADGDVRLGPVLEAIVNGRYYWIPFHRISKVQIDQPVDLRDIVWMPAHFSWANGGEAVGLIPTRYAGSETSLDGRIRLARKTEWLERDADTCLGLGQRMLATDAGEYPLMEIRMIALDTVGEPKGSA
jgi:type VI secretion system protein ImpE